MFVEFSDPPTGEVGFSCFSAVVVACKHGHCNCYVYRRICRCSRTHCKTLLRPHFAAMLVEYLKPASTLMTSEVSLITGTRTMHKDTCNCMEGQKSHAKDIMANRSVYCSVRQRETLVTDSPGIDCYFNFPNSKLLHTTTFQIKQIYGA